MNLNNILRFISFGNSTIKYWIGCIVMAMFAIMLFDPVGNELMLWCSQIVMGIVGMCRELVIKNENV
jgi:hypothetical protein